MKLTVEQKHMLSAYTANAMPADNLVTLGARASAGMILAPLSWNIPSSASEELMYFWNKISWNYHWILAYGVPDS